MRRDASRLVTCLSLLSSSGFSSLRRAVSVCMNLLKSVSFLRPPALLVFPARVCARLAPSERTNGEKTHALFALVFFVRSKSSELRVSVQVWVNYVLAIRTNVSSGGI